jgi:hypothetical protein
MKNHVDELYHLHNKNKRKKGWTMNSKLIIALTKMIFKKIKETKWVTMRFVKFAPTLVAIAQKKKKTKTKLEGC